MGSPNASNTLSSTLAMWRTRMVMVPVISGRSDLQHEQHTPQQPFFWQLVGHTRKQKHLQHSPNTDERQK